MKSPKPQFRMVAWGPALSGVGVASCDDVGRYDKLDDVVDWAQSILDAGNALYIDVYQGDKKVKTLYPKGATLQ